MIDVADKENIPRLKLPKLYEYVDKNQTSMIDALKEAVAIPSLSREEHFIDITKMLKLCQSKLHDLGAKTELISGKDSVRRTGSSFYPPILFGNVFIDEGLKTICVYGHVDTVSTKIEEDSGSEGFDLKIKNGRMHGRGVSRSKGPLLCWFNALKIYQATKSEIPVNVKFIVEGSAELHSPTLHEIVEGKKKFFQDVDYMCFTIDKKINDGPCLRYGYRGICHFSLDITCGEKDIDSGKYGGAFDQPLIDAIRIVSSLMDKHDKLAIPNVVMEAAPLSLQEKEIIDKVQPDIEEIKKKIGVKRLRHKENASRIAVHKTRLPCISVHGFETGTDYSDPKNRETISCRTVAKFSIRLVPDQTARDTRIHVENYIRKMWSQYKSVNNFELRMDMAIDPCKEDPTSLHYVAAASAMKLVYGKDPLYVCDGYSLPAVSIVKAICPRTSSLILPLSDVNDFNQNDESMSIENYLNSVKVIMAYMCYINEF